MASEEDVGQFALIVGLARIVALVAVEVLKLDCASSVGHTGHVDDPTGGRLLYFKGLLNSLLNL